jgi:hypothetical protein
MEIRALKSLVEDIVKDAELLKNKHIKDDDSKVNYACIFSQTQEEYQELVAVSSKLGKVVKETPSGPLFHIQPIKTVAGNLQLLKIRLPDATRPERGDADFTISNYPGFKEEYLSKKGFKLIPRDNFEMIELMDPESDVRAYFSYPPLDEQLGIKNQMRQ